MKRFFFLIVFVAVSGFLTAQISWNVKGGISLNGLYSSFSSSSLYVGGRAGVGMEWHLNRYVSIQPALMISQKGAKSTSTTTITVENQSGEKEVTHKKYSYDYNLTYLELPIELMVRIPLHHSNALLLAAGPYFAYGIGGNSNMTKTVNDSSTKQTLSSFGNDGLNLRRFDFGLGNGIYFEHKHFFTGLHYELGLVNMEKTFDDSFWVGALLGKHNLSYNFDIGYRF